MSLLLILPSSLVPPPPSSLSHHHHHHPNPGPPHTGTTQVCNFRDAYAHVTSTGLAIYGLSKDSPKANSSFKDKQKLPYALLCDPAASLIAAIGLKKAPSGTTRGVFVVDKAGKVLAAQPGSPGGTLTVVEKLIAAAAAAPAAAEPETAAENGTNGADETAEEKKDVAPADVAAQVADTAEKLDPEAKPAGV